MEKRMGLVGVSLIVVLMVLLSCAPGQKTLITNNNLSALKGSWQGWTTFSSFQGHSVLTTMEINNDTVPVKGRITLINLPGPIASIFPADAKTAGNNVIIDFANGKISDQGTLIGQSGENFLELTYSGGERPKLNGWFYYTGAKGTMDLNKK
jgi:hypothetical protein